MILWNFSETNEHCTPNEAIDTHTKTNYFTNK